MDTPNNQPSNPASNQPSAQAKPYKHWWQSKTVWFNVFVIVIGVLADAIPHFQPYMTADSYELVLALIAVANVVLRMVTRKPIAPVQTTRRDGSQADEVDG